MIRRWMPFAALLLLALTGCGDGGTAPTPATAPSPTATPTPAPTLARLQNAPPVDVFMAVLLTDGSVLAQAAPSNVAGISAAQFYRLTPDATGNYAAGTWTRVSSPPAGYAPYAGAEAVLADGRVLFVGGEYNQDNYSLPFAPSGLTNMSAIYDPVADRWQMIPPPPGVAYIGDPASLVLPDGRFLFGGKLDRSMWALDPATLTWSALPQTGKADNFAEEGLTLLPNGTVLAVDMANSPQSEHFVLATGSWVADGPTPVVLTSPTDHPAGLTYGPAPAQTVGGVAYGPGGTGTYFPPGEIGPAVLRPDGTVFATGSALASAVGHTAIYRPGASPGVAGSWTAGPDFPAVDNAGDSSAALLVNGNVLVAGASGSLYEFDGASLKRTILSAQTAANGLQVFLLPLPSGQVLALIPGSTVPAGIYTPVGAPLPAWQPTITAVPVALTRGSSYPLTGTQLNGLSQAQAYGDEFAAATNYPLVRLTMTATGHVFYARTHDHTSMGVATGNTPVTTRFDVPAGMEAGAASLVVVANGIASAPVAVTVG